jgi:O-methyltransferase/methyltransferase family protein
VKLPPPAIVRAVLGASRAVGRLRRAITPAPVALVELTSGGFIVSCAILTATRLGVPDALTAGPRTASELATSLGVVEEPLYRLLRALVHAGVLARRGEAFELNALSRLLVADTPGSMRDILLLGAETWHHDLWGELGSIVQTGRPAHEAVLGMPLYQHLERDADANAVFNRAMTSYSAQMAAALVAAYDFTSAHTLVDVGGGVGHVLAAALGRHTALRGTLFDLPHVVAQATPVLAPVADRVDIVGGDFFAAVPRGGDAYVLMNILHNWPDAEARAILERCRDALEPGARLAIVEQVIPEDRPDFAAIFDLEMLVLFRGGRERTRAEFETLLAGAGLRLDRVVATASPVVVLEARAS